MADTHVNTGESATPFVAVQTAGVHEIQRKPVAQSDTPAPTALVESNPLITPSTVSKGVDAQSIASQSVGALRTESQRASGIGGVEESIQSIPSSALPEPIDTIHTADIHTADIQAAGLHTDSWTRTEPSATQVARHTTMDTPSDPLQSKLVDPESWSQPSMNSVSRFAEESPTSRAQPSPSAEVIAQPSLQASMNSVNQVAKESLTAQVQPSLSAEVLAQPSLQARLNSVNQFAEESPTSRAQPSPSVKVIAQPSLQARLNSVNQVAEESPTSRAQPSPSVEVIASPSLQARLNSVNPFAEESLISQMQPSPSAEVTTQSSLQPNMNAVNPFAQGSLTSRAQPALSSDIVGLEQNGGNPYTSEQTASGSQLSHASKSPASVQIQRKAMTATPGTATIDATTSAYVKPIAPVMAATASAVLSSNRDLVPSVSTSQPKLRHVSLQPVPAESQSAAQSAGIDPSEHGEAPVTSHVTPSLPLSETVAGEPVDRGYASKQKTRVMPVDYPVDYNVDAKTLPSSKRMEKTNRMNRVDGPHLRLIQNAPSIIVPADRTSAIDPAEQPAITPSKVKDVTVVTETVYPQRVRYMPKHNLPSSAETQPMPTLHVTIGRVIVQTATQPSKAPSPRARPTQPVLSLDAYLQQPKREAV